VLLTASESRSRPPGSTISGTDCGDLEATGNRDSLDRAVAAYEKAVRDHPRRRCRADIAPLQPRECAAFRYEATGLPRTSGTHVSTIGNLSSAGREAGPRVGVRRGTFLGRLGQWRRAEWVESGRRIPHGTRRSGALVQRADSAYRQGSLAARGAIPVGECCIRFAMTGDLEAAVVALEMGRARTPKRSARPETAPNLSG